MTARSRRPLRLHSGRLALRALRAHLRSGTGGYDLVCVEHEALAPLLPHVRSQPWVLTFHHLLSGMIEKELALAGGRRQRWLLGQELTKARALERRAVHGYDRCLVCSEADAERLGSIGGAAPAGRIAIVPNGVDLAAFTPRPLPGEPRVLLPGTLAWGPNIDGAVWFCHEIWPQIRARVPAATLVLAGRSPVAEVLELGRLPGVSVHPDVPSMGPFFEAARVIVVPLRVGTGTRIKALEAMAAARPVVGTTVGLDGLQAVDGLHVRVADDESATAGAVAELLIRDELAQSLGAAGRAHVEQRFGWDRIGARFVAAVADLLAGSSGPQPPDRPSSSAA